MYVIVSVCYMCAIGVLVRVWYLWVWVIVPVGSDESSLRGRAC